MTNTFHQTAIAGKDVGAVINDVKATTVCRRSIKGTGELLCGDGEAHTDRDGDEQVGELLGLFDRCAEPDDRERTNETKWQGEWDLDDADDQQRRRRDPNEHPGQLLLVAHDRRIANEVPAKDVAKH